MSPELNNSEPSDDTDLPFTLDPVERTKESVSSMVINQIHPGVPNAMVRPVMTGPAAWQTPMFGHPLMQEILKSLVKPKFSGRNLDWQAFVKDWERYVSKISCGSSLSDSDRLALFEGCLDSETNLWLQSLKDSENGISYQEFFAKLEDKYGIYKDKGARKRWQDLSIPDSGKLSPRDWESFEIRFRLAQKEVFDATEEEAYRLLSSKLQYNMNVWVVDKETELNNKHPGLYLQIKPGMTQPKSRHFV